MQDASGELRSHCKFVRLFGARSKQTNKFVQFCENKVILVIAEYEDGSQVSYHHNVLINNDTTFKKYWNQIKTHVNEKFISGNPGYPQTVVSVYKVLVWDSDNFKNKHIKISKTAIGSLKTQILGIRKYHTSSIINNTN